MTGNSSGYPLHFYSPEPEIQDDVNRVAQLFQNHLIESNSLYQLPSDIEDFTGREAEIQHVSELIEQGIREDKNSATIIKITGQAGVGKSTLAIRLAHQLKVSFPDAQLYIDLRGTEQQPRQPNDILVNLLRGLGIRDREMPTSQVERSHLFQSLLTNKYTVLVLDNAADETQLDPLIPKNCSSIVLITSRKPLAALEEATALDLAALQESEALELLHKLVNQEVIRLVPGHDQKIVKLCRCLPLAIRLISGMLKNHSPNVLIECTSQLESERKRIEPLHLSHTNVRLSFNLIYRQLEPEAAQLLRLLGLLLEIDFTLPIAAILMETNLDSTGHLVGQLVDMKLVKRLGGERYQIVHEVVRSLARSQLALEELPETRQSARLRVVAWYLNVCQIMNLGLSPQTCHALAQVVARSKRQSLPTVEQRFLDEALNWFETEWFKLLTGVEWAFQAEAWVMVIALAEQLIEFLRRRSAWPAWERIHQFAIAATQQLGDRQKTAQFLNNLGNAALYQNKPDKAREYYEQSIAIFQELKDPVWIAKTLANIGVVHVHQGQQLMAIEAWKDALAHLPDASANQQTLQQWMQTTAPEIWQHMHHSMGDREAPQGLLGNMKKAIKRLIFE